MTTEEALKLVNRGMFAFDLALGTGTLIAPRQTLWVLGHEKVSADGEATRLVVLERSKRKLLDPRIRVRQLDAESIDRNAQPFAFGVYLVGWRPSE